MDLNHWYTIELAIDVYEVDPSLLDGSVDSVDGGAEVEDANEEMCELLLRSILHLGEYLNYLRAGHQDTPTIFMPLLNDLRCVRGEPCVVVLARDLSCTGLAGNGYVEALKCAGARSSVGNGN